MDMCFGQQIISDVLKLVQDDMAVLSTSVDENKESWKQGHEGLMNTLHNLRERFADDFSKLEAKHAALESGLISVKEDHLKLKEVGVSLSRGIDKLNSKEETVPPDKSASGN